MDDHREHMRESLELNLFFLRIMKEHCLFLQLGFMPKNIALATEAEGLRNRFDALLQRTIDLAKGFVSRAVMTSGELFTRYTQEAERQAQYFTGIPINSNLTLEEYNVGGGSMPPESMNGDVMQLNQNAQELTASLLQFKERIHSDVVACRIFTANYPLLLEHIIREARHYLGVLHNWIGGNFNYDLGSLAGDEGFWNTLMMEHAEFIDGQLDPSEKELKRAASAFARQYERLEAQQQAAQTALQMLPERTEQSEKTTQRFRNFKTSGVDGILSCKVRSVINPLLADHVLREANHYLRLLREKTALLSR